MEVGTNWSMQRLSGNTQQYIEEYSTVPADMMTSILWCDLSANSRWQPVQTGEWSSNSSEVLAPCWSCCCLGANQTGLARQRASECLSDMSSHGSSSNTGRLHLNSHKMQQVCLRQEIFHRPTPGCQITVSWEDYKIVRYTAGQARVARTEFLPGDCVSTV